MSEAVDVLSHLRLPQRSLKVGPRTFKADKDPALFVLLTAASWCLQRLPAEVVEEQRAELIRTLGQARDLVVEVHCRVATVLVRDGDMALVKIPAQLPRS